MTIKAQDVKELREKTGLGMMECKKALEEANGNLEEAIKNFSFLIKFSLPLTMIFVDRKIFRQIAAQ